MRVVEAAWTPEATRGGHGRALAADFPAADISLWEVAHRSGRDWLACRFAQ
jgi:hypothetical protein